MYKKSSYNSGWSRSCVIIPLLTCTQSSVEPKIWWLMAWKKQLPSAATSTAPRCFSFSSTWRFLGIDVPLRISRMDSCTAKFARLYHPRLLECQGWNEGGGLRHQCTRMAFFHKSPQMGFSNPNSYGHQCCIAVVCWVNSRPNPHLKTMQSKQSFLNAQLKQCFHKDILLLH